MMNETPDVGGRRLLCFCDHCLNNNTCLTDQDGLCYAKLSLDRNGEIKQNLNCFNPGISLFKNILCNDSTNTSFTRCCNSGPFCNSEPKFLHQFDEARQTFLINGAQSQLSRQNNTSNSNKINNTNQISNFSLSDLLPGAIFEKYSNLSTGLQVILAALPLILIVIFIAFIFARKYKRRIRRGVYYTTASSSDDRSSENSSSGKITSDSAVSDTNSMASREPLINRESSKQNNFPQKVEPVRHKAKLKELRNPQIHLGPHMAEMPQKPKLEPSSFQITIGGCKFPPPQLLRKSEKEEELEIEQGRVQRHEYEHEHEQKSHQQQQPQQLNPPSPQLDPKQQQKSRQPEQLQLSQQSSLPPSVLSLRSKPEPSSGSGAGSTAYLCERTISHDIELKRKIGDGYFGEVWLGRYKNEYVAVKKFSAIDEPSYRREVEIYNSTLFRHKNILNFIAADDKIEKDEINYIIVTDYFPMGSLYDFLNQEIIDIQDAVRMAYSVASGLAYLHREVRATRGKIAIAHRDIKSKNILVKSDGSCCLADFGMALRHNSETGIIDAPINLRVGTRRYLAPEILEESINLMDFESLKSADMYSLGLVLWELLRRTCFTIPPDHDFSPPDDDKYPRVMPELKLVPPDKFVPPANLSEPMELSRSPVSYASEPDMLSLKPTFMSPALKRVPDPPQRPDSDSDDQYAEQQPVSESEIISSSPTDSQETSESPLKYSYEPSLGPPLSIESSISDPEHELAFLCDSYQVPYQDFVSLDPSTEEMIEVVCTKKLRPPLSKRWAKFGAIRECSQLMCECWYEKPQSRLSAQRLKKSLCDLAESHFGVKFDGDST